MSSPSKCSSRSPNLQRVRLLRRMSMSSPSLYSSRSPSQYSSGSPSQYSSRSLSQYSSRSLSQISNRSPNLQRFQLLKLLILLKKLKMLRCLSTPRSKKHSLSPLPHLSLNKKLLPLLLMRCLLRIRPRLRQSSLNPQRLSNKARKRVPPFPLQLLSQMPPSSILLSLRKYRSTTKTRLMFRSTSSKL
jgi:hypothetical protein